MTIISLLLALNAHADLGPKPTMSFKWKEKGKVEAASLRLLQCKEESCNGAEPLQDAGPQGFRCSEIDCFAMAYGFSEFQQIVGKAGGKEVRSNVFKPQGMESKFELTVKDGKIIVSVRK